MTTEIKNINISFENERKKYIYETETLRNNLKEMEIELKVTKQQLLDERNNFKQYESESSEKLQSLETELKNM